MKSTCLKCVFSIKPVVDRGALECRRFPPTMMLLPGPPTLAAPNQPTVNLTPMHALVLPDHWCGEFENPGVS